MHVTLLVLRNTLYVKHSNIREIVNSLIAFILTTL